MNDPSTSDSLRSGRKNIIALGLVSMFNDMASEMVYPVIPMYLTKVLGASPAIVGLVEGIAEATASFLKVVSGWISDRVRNRKRFAAAGYACSALAKVGLFAAVGWPHVLGARFADRFGKGIRTAPRDALIAESAPREQRASAFGLHRALDTAGAVVGPLLALAYLSYLGDALRPIFLVAAIPAFVGVGILLAFVREARVGPQVRATGPVRSFTGFPPRFTVFLVASTVFALGNSSDAFLLLRSQTLGHSVAGAILLYTLFNAVYSALSYPFGKLADRVGSERVLIVSFLVFAGVYLCFGLAGEGWMLWGLFPLYGVYMAMSEGIGKAYVSGHVPADRIATAMGLFTAVTGAATLAASVLAGYLWTAVGVQAPFVLGAGCALVACLIFAAGLRWDRAARRAAPGITLR